MLMTVVHSRNSGFSPGMLKGIHIGLPPEIPNEQGQFYAIGNATNATMILTAIRSSSTTGTNQF